MTIYDVARKAGVSIATVSRVINNSDLVTDDTRRLVKDVMKKLGYRPNIFAQGLVTDTMKTIGIVTIDIRDSFFAQTLYTVNCEMQTDGYGAIITNVEDNPQELMRGIDFLMDRRVDGLILVGSVYSDAAYSQVIKDAATRVPVVLLNGVNRGRNIYSVICDDEDATYKLMDIIHNSGKKRPIYVHGAKTKSTRDKLKGYKRAVRELFNCSANSVATELSVEGGMNITSFIINGGYDSAIFSCDLIASGFIKKAVEAGVEIPRDIAVAGYDNQNFSKITTPSLTTVDNKVSDLSKLAAHTLIQAMEGERPKKELIITGDIIVRKSI